MMRTAKVRADRLRKGDVVLTEDGQAHVLARAPYETEETFGGNVFLEAPLRNSGGFLGFRLDDVVRVELPRPER